jgi:type IV conjugative transfer system protein TraL
MSDAINNHVILSHIDRPQRILLWPAGQFFGCAIPLAVGMTTDHAVIGLVFSALCVCCFRRFSDRFGRGRFRTITYWHLPTAARVEKLGVPPSHVRYWIK